MRIRTPGTTTHGGPLSLGHDWLLLNVTKCSNCLRGVKGNKSNIYSHMESLSCFWNEPGLRENLPEPTFLVLIRNNGSV